MVSSIDYFHTPTRGLVYFKFIKLSSTGFTVSVKSKDITHIFNGSGKYKKVLKTQASCILKGQSVQMVAYTCNYQDTAMLNVVFTSAHVDENKLCDMVTQCGL